MTVISTLFFILLLGILVLIHEFGHYIAAKKSGVLVEEFGFGFPPRLWGKKIGETIYSINWLPIGGFVKVFGEEYHETDSHIAPNLRNRAFVNKPPWIKTIIIVAGVVMNLILAVAIYYVLLGTNNFQSDPLFLVSDYKFRFGRQIDEVAVTTAVKNSPAEKAGIQSGDVLLKYRIPSEFQDWRTVSSSDELIKTINAAQGKAVGLELQNVKDNSRKIVTVVPQYNNSLKRAVIGIGLANMAVISYDQPVDKLLSGFFHSYNITAYSLNTFASLIGTSYKERSLAPVSETAAGPVGIFAIVDQVVKGSGQKFLANFLNLVALLSLSLATLNILPFPALDGGRLVFIFYEWITGRRPNAALERNVNYIGMLLILALSVLITYNDIVRLLNH